MTESIFSHGTIVFMSGVFIVIEGADGSGKATQTKLLLDRLEKEGHKADTTHFPQYEGNVFGELIGECLAGGRGDYLSLDPRITSVLYAGDRFESKDKIQEMLEKNDVIVLDRYVSSNQIHQGGRVKDKEERPEFFRWLDNLEYELFGLPRPDHIIFLAVPVEVSMRLSQEKAAKDKKPYLQGNKDVYEENKEYIQSSRDNAFALIEYQDDWHCVDCVEDDNLLSREAIHEKVWELVSNFLNNK